MDEDEQWRQLALLADPVRRTVLAQLAADVELTRDEVAAGAGISPALAGHHLTKLVEGGLLQKRAAVGRGLRGRPPATYLRGAAPQVPNRRPELLHDLLTAGRPDMGRVRAAAREQGRTAVPGSGSARARVTTALRALGFGPMRRGAAVESGSCPFLARQLADPETACDVALSLAEGIADEVPGTGVERVVGGACCVRVLTGPGKKAR